MNPREELSKLQGDLAGQQKPLGQIIDDLEACCEAGEPKSMLMAKITHLAWAMSHVACVVQVTKVRKLLTLALVTQEKGSLPQAVTEMAIINFGADLIEVVQNICEVEVIYPAWEVKVRSGNDVCPTSIERTLPPENSD